MVPILSFFFFFSVYSDQIPMSGFEMIKNNATCRQFVASLYFTDIFPSKLGLRDGVEETLSSTQRRESPENIKTTHRYL